MTKLRVSGWPTAPDPFRDIHEKADWILRRLEDPTHPLPGDGPEGQDWEQLPIVAIPPTLGPRELADRIAAQIEREMARGSGGGDGGDEAAFGSGPPQPSPYDDPNPSLLGAMPVGPVPLPTQSYADSIIPVPSPDGQSPRDYPRDRMGDSLPAWLPYDLRSYLHGGVASLAQIPTDLERLRQDFARDWPAALASLGPSLGPYGAAPARLAQASAGMAQAAGYAIPATKQGWNYLNRVGWDLPAALDNNALVAATKEGLWRQVDSAIGPGQPVGSIQAAREFIVEHGVDALRSFLASRGGRIAAAATDDEVRELQKLARAMKPMRVLHTPDGRIAASALHEEAPLITRDRQLTGFMKEAEFDHRGY